MCNFLHRVPFRPSDLKNCSGLTQRGARPQLKHNGNSGDDYLGTGTRSVGNKYTHVQQTKRSGYKMLCI